jgi:hypothetical protein
LARQREQIRASDVTFWGVGALIACGLAVLGAGASAILPGGLLAGLHTPLVQTANIGQLQAQIADLQAGANVLKADNVLLMQRVALNEQQKTDITKRLGALEVSMPRLIEAVNTPAPVDAGIVTGSTTTSPPIVQAADGGTVSYTTSPLAPGAANASAAAIQPMPSALVPAASNASAYGLALGPPILDTEGPDAWKSMTDRAGTLMVGLTPLLAAIEGVPGRRLVAGPLATEADARELCGSFARLGIACSSVPFIGQSLPPM